MEPSYKTRFIEAALRHKALQFGSFTLKSGRQSPYFFNGGVFYTGEALAQLGSCYTEAIQAHMDAPFDVLFGPAYKGIPLVCATSQIWYQQRGQALPFAYNRKERKDHGEGGQLVGPPLAGQRVLLVDDVITAGTAIQDSLPLLKQAGALLVGIVVALDREEINAEGIPTLTALSHTLKIPVFSVITLSDILKFASEHPAYQAFLPAIQAYRAQYGLN